jgi:V/A-type H+-transporting ATPase subunit I
LCLTDAGYGLVLLIGSLIGIKLLGRGAAKLLGVLAIGGGAAVVLGAITSGYFGNAPQVLGWPWLIGLRDYLLQFGFDPFKSPMTFFILAIILGYVQIMVGLFIGLIHNLRRKDFVAASCDHLTWILLLNSIVVISLAKIGMLPTWPAPICLVLLSTAAVGIVLGSQREGGRGERLGMGLFNLFSAIFYLGDVLSYLRLMGLGLVTAGIAMAVNLIAGLAWKMPIVGAVAGVFVLIVGHIGNLLLSSLSAFVHTLRLQYVEFFPKFFMGGGAEFRPFARVWKYTKVEP